MISSLFMEAPGKPIILYFIVEYISICIYFLIEKIMRSLCGIRDSESNGAAGFIHVAQELDAVEQAVGGAYPARHRFLCPCADTYFSSAAMDVGLSSSYIVAMKTYIAFIPHKCTVLRIVDSDVAYRFCLSPSSYRTGQCRRDAHRLRTSLPRRQSAPRILRL